MEKEHDIVNVSEPDLLHLHLTEDSMESLTAPVRVQLANRTTPTDSCLHRRVIDDVLTRGKQRTGKVRCLECGAIFADPYQGQRR